MTSSENVEGSTAFPPAPPAQVEQRMGEAIFGPDYTGPATAEAQERPKTTTPDGKQDQAMPDPYAPTTWGVYDEELTVSSGQRCRVRKLDFKDVMSVGLLDKLNTLQGVVDRHVKKGEGQPPVDAQKLLKDKRTSAQFSELIDQVVVLVVTAPKLEMPPRFLADRRSGVVYVDTVGLVDKMEIFERALGALKDLESFRGGASKSAERMADEQSDGLSS